MKKKIKNKVNYSWIIKIVLISFAISIFLSFIAETLLPNVNIIIGILIMILFSHYMKIGGITQEK